MENNYTLDKIDFDILGYLQEDGRRSFTEIAEKMGVSVGTIRNRYNKLVEDNVLHIIGWTDPVKAGYNSYARINISVRPTGKIREVAQQLIQLPEVSFLGLTSGNFDLEMNVLCKTNSDLMQLMHEQVHQIDGVFETNTTVYFEILKWASHDISNALGDHSAERSHTTSLSERHR